MNILRILLTKIGKVFLIVFTSFRRVLCCFRRRRLSDALPFTANNRSHLSSGIENAPMQSWNTWDDDERSLSSVAVDGDGFHQSHTHSTRETTNRSGLGRFRKSESESAAESDVDFFEDMVPEIRKPAKIIIRKRDDLRDPMGGFAANCLAVDPQLASGVGAELGHWEENEGSWEDSMDINIDDDSIHRETKLLDRERRAAENMRRKQEKDANRMSSKRDHLATKIS